MSLQLVILAVSTLVAAAQPSPPAAKADAKAPEAKSAESKPAESKPAETPAAPKTAGAPASDEAFTLENSLNLRDPFRKPPSKAAFGAEGGNIPPLERYELDRYKLVGVITGPRKNKALITDPDGKMHVVSEAMFIGTRHGKITHIRPGQILVEEKVVNLLGQEEKVESALEFAKDEKDKEGKP
jgi:Tfp pilus assembly protein PilP